MYPVRCVQFWKYAVGSAIGILPGVCLYVMLGSLAGGIAMASAGEMDEMSHPILLFTTVGVSIVILIILIAVPTRCDTQDFTMSCSELSGECACSRLSL